MGLVFVWYRKLENLPNLYLINIGVDIFGTLMGFVLFIACMIDVQKTGSDQRYFLRLLSVAFLGLFTDLVAWLVDGLPSMRVVNILDNTLYYLCTPVETILKNVRDAVDGFVKETEQFDDLTMLCLEYTGPETNEPASAP